jgi:putative phosphoribosyl transferase
VVDDGVATGATARAAARAARQKGAARVILAAPVVAAASEPDLRADFDEVVAVELPPSFYAVGAWYERFDQVSDGEVLEVLARARPAGAAEPSGELWNGEWMGPDPAAPPRGEGRSEVVVEIPLAPPVGRGVLEAFLAIPPRARGLVLFVHGSGSTRKSPRNRFVAETLGEVGLATLLFDLLTPTEAEADEFTARLRFDIGLLTRRVIAATRWVEGRPDVGALPLGYFGASTGAAAALAAAAALPGRVAAVVSRGGRPDLVAPAVLAEVRAPVLLLVGGRDEAVLGMNRAAAAHLHDVELSVVPGATHLFEEAGALETVARRAADFFGRHLAEAAHAPGEGRP